jgi:hypothetical protein
MSDASTQQNEAFKSLLGTAWTNPTNSRFAVVRDQFSNKIFNMMNITITVPPTCTSVELAFPGGNTFIELELAIRNINNWVDRRHFTRERNGQKEVATNRGTEADLHHYWKDLDNYL